MQQLVALLQCGVQTTEIRDDCACNSSEERIAGSGGHRLTVAKESACLVKKGQCIGGGENAGEDSQVLGVHAGFWTGSDTVGAAGIAGNTCCGRIVLIDEAIDAGTTPTGWIAQGRPCDFTADALFGIILRYTGVAAIVASMRNAKGSG
jgi:hypothetical protein